jgi:hypothetical protein
MTDKRASNGRFLPGHGGGPGNPHAQRVHRLRSALLGAVGPADVKDVVDKLLEMAKLGDLGAIRELFDRCLGKPVTALELTGPDRGPLLHVGRVQGEILHALSEFPDARIAVALRLMELSDAQLPEPPEADGLRAGSVTDDGVAGDGA